MEENVISVLSTVKRVYVRQLIGDFSKSKQKTNKERMESARNVNLEKEMPFIRAISVQYP